MPASTSGTIFPQALQARVIGAAAADATYDYVVGVAGTDSSLVSASFTPDTVLTGADTNSATLEIINAGQTGVGTTQAAAKAFTSGVNAPAKDETDLTLHATLTNRDFVAGDVIVFRRTKVGTGLTVPAGVVRLKLGGSA